MAILDNARYQQIYDEFPFANTEDEDIILLYRPSIGITGGLKRKDFGAGDTQAFEWVSTEEYDIDEVVTFDGKWWQSLQNVNIGNTPQDGVWWVEISKGVVFTQWTPGVYVDTEVFVYFSFFYGGNAGITFYRLKSAIRPYNSSNLLIELNAGDWEVVGSVYNYSQDTGVADAYIMTIDNRVTSYFPGLRMTMLTNNANTGASTVNVNGLGVKNIVRRDGSALQAGDIAAGSLNELVYDGNDFQLMNGGGSSLSINNTRFVSTGGDDGTAELGNPSKPYATAAAAAAAASSGETISFMPGTHTISNSIAVLGVKYRTFGGNVTLQSSAIIWDYSLLALSTDDIDVKGDFIFEINGVGAGVYKAGTSTNLNVLFEYKRLVQTTGNISFQTNTACNSLSIIGEEQFISDGRYLKAVSSTTGCQNGLIKVNIRSTAPVEPIYLTCDNTDYIGSVVTTASGAFRVGTSPTTRDINVSMSVNQFSGGISQVPNGNYNLNWIGGNFEPYNGCDQVAINGRFYDCTLRLRPQVDVSLNGNYNTCTIYNDQATLVSYDGYFEDCALTFAGNPKAIWNGTGKTITFNSSNIGGHFILNGEIELASTTKVNVNSSDKLEINGKLIGDRAGELILHNQSSNSRLRIKGQVVNKDAVSASARVIAFTAGQTNFNVDLVGAILEAGASATDSINLPGTSSVNFKLYNQSYVNIAPVFTGTPTYLIGVAGDLITNSNVDVII